MGLRYWIFWFSIVWAQQTLVNLPSIEITHPKRVFVLHESQIRFWHPEPHWVTTHFLTYGLSHKVELAVTLHDIGIPRQAYRSLAIGYKCTEDIFARELPELELKWALGQMLIVSLSGRRPGLWTYVLWSMRIPHLRTRLSAGINAGPPALFGETGHKYPLDLSTIDFIGSIEQPIGEHVNIILEWFSGRHHEFASLIPGLIVNWKDWTFVLGCRIPNDAEEGISLVTEVGHTF
ncbi:MAG: hypothetical protein NZ580_02685 [Bacteroidia bacterium]|nr:hypothetical protein [Bacteroidia bacterium]MDW8235693.1 hypothetical protein [Bacteroidia bacterium]